MKNNTYHIIFDKNYYNKEIGFRSRKHPTWNFTTINGINLNFGGKLDRLNHLISFETDFIVNGINLRGEKFGINFEEFFNAQINGKYLFYKHTKSGELQSLIDNIEIECKYSDYPLKETNVVLAITPKEYTNQEWEGNCNRIGGDPIWIQEPEYLHCPKCNSKMSFIFQLDSGLPDLNENGGNEIMFGNDGICYAFWCDKDKVSGYLWQC
ncbi:hypothetical protein [uncultured Aquimarina sp.]|uniref:hypothetical protein n=1 Tax=uncultured Aquimarina sp. TaxID=575652 RepID=UPI00260E7612|nr:hypothetical protein [uncultured Aquimarina sp.]